MYCFSSGTGVCLGHCIIFCLSWKPPRYGGRHALETELVYSSRSELKVLHDHRAPSRGFNSTRISISESYSRIIINRPVDDYCMTLILKVLSWKKSTFRLDSIFPNFPKGVLQVHRSSSCIHTTSTFITRICGKVRHSISNLNVLSSNIYTQKTPQASIW